MIQTVPEAEVTATITASLRALLATQPVTFLVSGGSATNVAAAIARTLDSEKTSHILTIGQVDERYGDIDHTNANWPKFLAALGETKNLTLRPILVGKSFEETIIIYEEFLHEQANNPIVALFGMGLDSHTAGILPYSPAATEDTAWVSGYQGNDFPRITLTPAGISQVRTGFLYAQGQAKYEVMFKNEDNVDEVQHPVQFLKTIKDISWFCTI